MVTIMVRLIMIILFVNINLKIKFVKTQNRAIGNTSTSNKAKHTNTIQSPTPIKHQI